jgi:hypothetical protein
VKSNDFVAKHVGARGQGSGNLDVPGVVGLCFLVSIGPLFIVSLQTELTNEVVRCPVARRVGTVVQALLGDLEEAEGARGSRRRVAADFGKVVNDRTVVALGPGVPLQLHGITSLDRDRGRSGLGRLVARDVAGAHVVGLDETLNKVSILQHGEDVGTYHCLGSGRTSRQSQVVRWWGSRSSPAKFSQKWIYESNDCNDSTGIAPE